MHAWRGGVEDKRVLSAGVGWEEDGSGERGGGGGGAEGGKEGVLRVRMTYVDIYVYMCMEGIVYPLVVRAPVWPSGKALDR